MVFSFLGIANLRALREGGRILEIDFVGPAFDRTCCMIALDRLESLG
jgi:hypothetical protein